MTLYSLELVAQQLREELKTRAPWAKDGWRWGRLRTDRQLVNQTLVVIRPDYGRDSYGHDVKKGNPRPVGELMCAGVIELHAYTGDVGAKEVDHHRRCKDLLHVVLAALRSIDLKHDLGFEYGAMGWVEPEAERQFGARYDIAFAVSETVYDEPSATASGVEYDGEGRIVIDGSEYVAC